MEEHPVEEYLSLQELGAALDTINFHSEDTYRQLPRGGLLSRDHLPHVTIPVKELEKDKNKGCDRKEEKNDATEDVTLQSQIEIAALQAKAPCLLVNRKTIERVVLAATICAISLMVILPFSLLIGKSVGSWSSSFDFAGSCYNRSNDDLGSNRYHDSCLAYENGVCGAYLMTDGLINITTLRSEAISEQDVASFFAALDAYSDIVTDECTEATRPFICRYVFPPCNGDGNYQLVSKDECLRLQYDICAAEWLLALSFAPKLLPDCERLNDNINMDEEIEPSHSNFEYSDTDSISDITCPDNFKLFCNDTCLPLCSQFSQYDELTTIARRNVDIVSATGAIIGGVLVIILTIARRKKMLQFPAVYTLYITFCPMIIAAFVLITHVDTERDLYCPHDELIKSYENPSLFCHISGGVFQCCLILMTMLWLFHLFHICVQVVFPVKSRILKTKKWSRVLHITEVLVSVLVGILGPASTWLSKTGYNFAFFPPLLCLPSSGVFVYYTMCIPIILILTIGLSLIATVLWTLFKKSNALNEDISVKKCSFGAPEVKTIILLTFYILFALMASILTGSTIRDSPQFIESLFAYFICQQHGDNSVCQRFQKDYMKYQKPNTTSVVFVMMGLINWVNLLFGVQYRDIKQVISKFSCKTHCYRRPTTEYTTASGTSGSSTVKEITN